MKSGRILIILGAILAISACKQAEQQAPVVRPAKVMKIATPKNYNQRDFPGKVQAGDRVNLSFEVPGKIIKFPVLEGSELKKGELVASLDRREYEYNLQQTEARYKFTQSQVDRFKVLYKKGYVSGLDYDKHVSDNNIARANLSQAQKDLKDTRLLAPFDGTIVRKYVKNYQQIKANEAVVSFQDIDHVDIKVNIPENVVANIKKEKKKDLRVRFEAVPGREFDVSVKEFSVEADPETQTYEAVLTMPAPKDVNILPGMTVTLMLYLPVRINVSKGVFLVPAGAVFANQQGKSSVWLLDPKKNTVKEQAVTTGELSNNEMQILKGLKSGDVIVIAGVHFLTQGQQVRPIKSKG